MAKEDKSLLGWFATVVAVGALAVAMFGLRSESASGAAATAASVDVVLSEFKISPAMISLPLEGGVLKIRNTGSAAHSFAALRFDLVVLRPSRSGRPLLGCMARSARSPATPPTG
jgi:hypothetical protein